MSKQAQKTQPGRSACLRNKGIPSCRECEAVWSAATELTGCRIGLKNAERISFSIQEVSLPAYARHGELGQRGPAAGVQDFVRYGIEFLDLHGADKRVSTVLRRRRFGRTL